MEGKKTIFIGTSDFAVPILEALLNTEFLEVSAVVTQPDKPVGRKQTMSPPPVKQFLDDVNSEAPILQPTSIRKASEEILNEYEPELIIVASYGQFIPKNMLDYPKYKCLNVHASLLPELRGAVPIPMAILKGLEKTGISIQIMEKKMDAGELLAQFEFSITNYKLRLPTPRPAYRQTRLRQIKITTEVLTQKLSILAAQELPGVLKKWIDGKIEPVPQDESKATFCYMSDIAKEKAEITFETDVEMAERMVRAFYPWPVAWFWLEQNGQRKRVKVFEAEIAWDRNRTSSDTPRPSLFQEKKAGPPLSRREGKKLFIELHDGVLELKELQLEGKQRKEANEYLFLGETKM